VSAGGLLFPRTETVCEFPAIVREDLRDLEGGFFDQAFVKTRCDPGCLAGMDLQVHLV
jgi:hypothetical protein